ncbi:unnamed protein product [Linum tenue]|uniref:Uncharacterized protein n=1 Tax=Linum tenue TaxID=586396 RepID=A0AAV0N2Y5_9ROSI|nr:unnamed protein product [Linum tenue]
MGVNFSLPADRSELLEYLQLVQRIDEMGRVLRIHGSFLSKSTDQDFMKRVEEIKQRVEEMPRGDGFAQLRKLAQDYCELLEHQIGRGRPYYQYMLYPAAGFIAIALSKTVTAPLSRLTILSQVGGMHYSSTALMQGSIMWEAVRVVADEGFKALWKGNTISVIRGVHFAIVSMGSYAFLRNLLGSIIGCDDANSTRMVNLMAGGLAGIEATMLSYSLDVVRTRLAAQRNSMYGLKGTWHAFRDLHCGSELHSPFLRKGFGLALLGTVPYMAISFFVYESFKSFLKARRPDDDSPIMDGLACGSIAGLAASTATYPLALVRRRMQLDGICGRVPIYTGGLLETFRTIIRKEGFQGLYRGIGPQCLRVVPGHAVAFMSFEMMKMSISAYQDFKRKAKSSK